MPEVLQPKDPAGVETLEIMSAAPQYNSWMYQAIAPFLGTRILEVGSGIGNMSAHLLSARPARLVLTDMDPWYRDQVGRRFGDHAEVTVSALTLPDPDASQRFSSERLDTVVALNVVEHIGDDVGAMTSMRQMLVPGGRAVILVPALPSIYGELDRELGHFRRYVHAIAHRNPSQYNPPKHTHTHTPISSCLTLKCSDSNKIYYLETTDKFNIHCNNFSFVFLQLIYGNMFAKKEECIYA